MKETRRSPTLQQGSRRARQGRRGECQDRSGRVPERGGGEEQVPRAPGARAGRPISLEEKDFDGAIASREANQQDPQVLYYTALAYKGKGDSAKAKEWAAKAANANVLPLASYAFVRQKAKKMAT